MNKRIFGVFVSLFIVAILATPVVSAVPWTYPKNNEKFQKFKAVGTFSFLDIIDGEHQWIPSFEKVNKHITSFTDPHDTYSITVDGKTYEQGTDFLPLEQLTVMVHYDPVYSAPGKKMPIETRESHVFVYWALDFSAIPGGIEGILRMRALNLQEGFQPVNSIAGTGDLKNVQVKAMASVTFTPPLTMNVLHEGRVSGWPDISPAT